MHRGFVICIIAVSVLCTSCAKEMIWLTDVPTIEYLKNCGIEQNEINQALSNSGYKVEPILVDAQNSLSVVRNNVGKRKVFLLAPDMGIAANELASVGVFFPPNPKAVEFDERSFSSIAEMLNKARLSSSASGIVIARIPDNKTSTSLCSALIAGLKDEDYPVVNRDCLSGDTEIVANLCDEVIDAKQLLVFTFPVTVPSVWRKAKAPELLFVAYGGGKGVLELPGCMGTIELDYVDYLKRLSSILEKRETVRSFKMYLKYLSIKFKVEH